MTKYFLFPPKRVLIWGTLRARRTNKQIKSLSIPKRGIRTSHLSTYELRLTALRFGDLRAIHRQFMTHIAATQQKGSTHLIPGCPDAVGSAGLKSSSLSGKTRDKERPLTDLRRSASGLSPYLGRIFRIQNRWMFGVCLGLAPT